MKKVNKQDKNEMNIMYRNVQKGKGLMLTGGFLAVCGFFSVFAIGTIGAGVLVLGMGTYGVGKIKYWWYNG